MAHVDVSCRFVGKHVAPRQRRADDRRLDRRRDGRRPVDHRCSAHRWSDHRAAMAAAAGVAFAVLAAPLATPAAALALEQSHGGGFGPLIPTASQPGGDPALTGTGSGSGSGRDIGAAGAAIGTGAAALNGSAVAALAWAQLGRGADGPNTLDGADFDGSSALPNAWCAAFAAWAWSSAGVSTSGLDGWAGSFLDYGVRNGTFHTGAPRVGDAALFALSGGVAQESAAGTLADSHLLEHVGIVVAVSRTTVTVVNGDWGDSRGGPQLVRVATYPTSQSDAPDYAPTMRQYLAGYVDPVGR